MAARWCVVGLLLTTASPMTSTVADAAPRGGRLAEFERALASTPSATQALANWCAARGLAAEPVIRAHQLGDSAPPADAATRRLLAVEPNEPLGHRHVRLMCGDLVLSEARNWYVPARLTPAMNEALASTDRPFGAVIAPLGFGREALDSREGAATTCPAGTILTNRAIIRAADGRALALVVECYQRAVLARSR